MSTQPTTLLISIWIAGCVLFSSCSNEPPEPDGVTEFADEDVIEVGMAGEWGEILAKLTDPQKRRFLIVEKGGRVSLADWEEDPGRPTSPVDPLVLEVTSEGVLVDGLAPSTDLRARLDEYLSQVVLVGEQPAVVLIAKEQIRAAEVREILLLCTELKLGYIAFGIEAYVEKPQMQIQKAEFLQKMNRKPNATAEPGE